MKRKLSALGATLVLAMVGGVGTAYAVPVPIPNPPEHGQAQDSSQSQEATNKVEQDANSTAVNFTGAQSNVNGATPVAPAPIASAVPGGHPSGGGDVNQSNSSGASSEAKNENTSTQSVDQRQGSAQTQAGGPVAVNPCGCKSMDGGQSQSSDQNQYGKNKVDQDANSTAVNTTLIQSNVNAPVRVLSPGDSEVNQSNESGAASSASNRNASNQSISQGQGSTQAQTSGGHGSGGQSQSSTQNQGGENKVEQNANSTAINTTLEQSNVNAPVFVGGRELTPTCGGCGGSSGNVNQSNRSGAWSEASNANHSSQSIDQDQASSQSQSGRAGCGCGGDQTQSSTQNQEGKNKVEQEANSTAINTTLFQSNVNQPVRVLSPGRDDVNQSNRSGAASSASNRNASTQSIDQGQQSRQSQAGGSAPHGCGCSGPGDQTQSSTQNQYGTNKVEQNANSTAVNFTGAQDNLNGGGLGVDSIIGGGSGDVNQSNSSTASSRASNRNWSTQSIDQGQGSSQTQSGRSVWNPHCGCSGPGDQTQSSTQNQEATNKVEQNANSTAFNFTGSQTNLNGGGGLRQFVGGGHPSGGDVNQSNTSGAWSEASNRNWSTQSIDQGQGSNQTQSGRSVWNPHCGCSGPGDQTQSSTQNQEATNKVEQNANSTAFNFTGSQTNLNGGGLFNRTLCGCGHPAEGDVNQSNWSGARSTASNQNRSSQAISQRQHGTQRQHAA
jgi:hypothetical protein